MTSAPTPTTTPNRRPQPIFFAVNIVADHGADPKALRPLRGRAPREP